jgi:light-harvesting complex 1 beta chain
MADNDGSWSGISDQEAQEFHSYYMQGMFLFVAIAVLAHLLVWFWRPWIPGPKGYAALMDGATSVAHSVLTLIS